MQPPASEIPLSSTGTVPTLGRLANVDPRVVWVNEARDFTPWLLGNADRLADALGIELELSVAEHPVGTFSLDLIGRDVTHDAVLIVENQLAGSDHSHLGQLMTYAAGTGASTIVWITTAFREEHRQVLDWLNEHTDETVRLFGIQLELVQIGDSLPAPLLKVVSQPNDWQKQVRSATADASTGGRSALYMDFWAQFLERIQADHPGWTRTSRPQPANWLTVRSIGGVQLNVSFAAGGRLRSELYIDTGDADQNVEIFSRLSRRKEELESVFGRRLEWEELSGRRASRVADYSSGDIRESEQFGKYTDWFLDGLGRWIGVLDRVRPDLKPPTTEGNEAATTLPPVSGS